jgi:hypothetical protein
MKQENRDFLNAVKPHWDLYKATGSMKDASVIHPERLQTVMREEWEPRYIACLTCPESIRELFEKVFQLYEKQLNVEANQAVTEVAGIGEDADGQHGTPDSHHRRRGRPRKG